MYLPVSALIVAVLALIVAYMALRAAIYRTGSHVTAAKFAELEAELTNQASSIDSVRLAMTKIRARLNAQSRKNPNGADSEPQFDLNTESGRTAARMKLEADLARSGKLSPKTHSRG